MPLVSRAPTASAAVSWDSFLSHLAIAEKAAADHFTRVAEGLHAEGHHDAAFRYEALADEEHTHYERVNDSYRDYLPPPAGIVQLYGGERASAGITFVERMAVAHFSHETAAIALLGQLHGHVHEHLEDTKWAKHLRLMCAHLLRDEVAHVRDGKVFVAQFLSRQNEAVREQVHAAVRLHRAAVIRLIRRLFPGDALRGFADAVIDRFHRRYQEATRGILGGTA